MSFVLATDYLYSRFFSSMPSSVLLMSIYFPDNISVPFVDFEMDICPIEIVILQCKQCHSAFVDSQMDIYVLLKFGVLAGLAVYCHLQVKEKPRKADSVHSPGSGRCLCRASNSKQTRGTKPKSARHQAHG